MANPACVFLAQCTLLKTYPQQIDSIDARSMGNVLLEYQELATIEVTSSCLYRLKVRCSAPAKGKKATQKSAAATRSKRATSKEAVAPVALVARRTTRQSSTEPLLQLANPNLADGTESEQDTRTDARYFSRSSCLDNTSQGYRVCSLITYSSLTPFLIKEETQVEVFERVPRQERGTSTGTARSHCQSILIDGYTGFTCGCLRKAKPRHCLIRKRRL
jgi:hypothetical protein